MVWNVKQNIQAWKIYFVKIEILKFQTNLKKLQNDRCFLSFLTKNDLLPTTKRGSTDQFCLS